MNIREFVEKAKKEKITLLGIGPVSKNVILCAIEVAREKNMPLIFLASRNQVENPELGKGYVLNWSSKAMADFIEKEACGIPYFLERDHGGPWQRDEERNPYIPEKEAFKRAILSYIDDIDSGFNLLHIDPTRRKNTNLARVLEDTCYLIEELEKIRKSRFLPEIDYEIGTEENYCGTMDEEKFRWFLRELIVKLKKADLPHPLFIVGQTGSLVKMDYNAGRFNPSAAARLASIAEEFHVGFKEHNTDYLEDFFLRMHPQCGITCANVAPEFGVVESKALLKLSVEEKMLMEKKKIKNISSFQKTFIDKAISSEKWKKWLDCDIKEIDLRDDFWKFRLTSICGHYVFNDTEVQADIEHMMNNLKVLYRSPEEIVKEEIRKAIRKYIACFNLEDFNCTRHK